MRGKKLTVAHYQDGKLKLLTKGEMHPFEYDKLVVDEGYNLIKLYKGNKVGVKLISTTYYCVTKVLRKTVES